jgi:hypothetical protein
MSGEIFILALFVCRRWKSSLKQLTQMVTVRYEFDYNQRFLCFTDFVLIVYKKEIFTGELRGVHEHDVP